MLPPEGVLKNGDMRRAFGGFSGKKCTTVLRFDSEGLEEIPIDHNAGESERLSVAGERISAAAEERHISRDLVEGAILFGVFVVDVDFVREGGEAAEAAIGIEPREPLGIGKWERAKEKRIDDAEDGDVGADA